MPPNTTPALALRAACVRIPVDDHEQDILDLEPESASAAGDDAVIPHAQRVAGGEPEARLTWYFGGFY